MPSTEPIDNIVWTPARELKANHYNPNVVMRKELTLLEKSILDNGWIQPILINPNNIIIDGFHRWQLSMDSPELQSKYAEEVPCAIIDVDDAEAMMMTVRINRAKGAHVAVAMSDLVKELIDEHGLDEDAVMEGIGATPGEIELLHDGSLLKSRNLKNYKYSRAWRPVETSHMSKEELEQAKADGRID